MAQNGTLFGESVTFIENLLTQPSVLDRISRSGQPTTDNRHPQQTAAGSGIADCRLMNAD